jgi:hypothetical protein
VYILSSAVKCLRSIAGRSSRRPRIVVTIFIATCSTSRLYGAWRWRWLHAKHKKIQIVFSIFISACSASRLYCVYVCMCLHTCERVCVCVRGCAYVCICVRGCAQCSYVCRHAQGRTCVYLTCT